MFKSLPTYFLTAALAALPATTMAKSLSANHDNRQATEILKDFAVTADNAADQADMLDANLRAPNLGKASYTARLEALKDDVNDMGRTLSRLEEMRAALSAADQEVLDHANILLRELANNTTAGINALNHDQENFWTPMWRQYIGNLVDESSRLSSSVNHAIALDKTRAREQQLEKAIETPGQ